MKPSAIDYQRLGFEGWLPPGTFDSRLGTWLTGADVSNTFPDSGVEVFDSVDETSFWFDHRNQVIEQFLRRYSQGGSILEVGSGSGVVAAHLASRGWVVASVEPIEGGAIRAAQRGVTVSICGDLSSLCLPSGCVPNIGLFDVIEHLETPGSLLEMCREALSKDGCLLVTVPAHQWLWNDFDEWNGHFRRYSINTARKELTTAGFDVVAASYFFLPLVVPAGLSRVVASPFRRPKTRSEIEDSVSAGLAPKGLLVDRMLRIVHRFELAALRKTGLPTGTSIVLVAKPRRA